MRRMRFHRQSVVRFTASIVCCLLLLLTAGCRQQVPDFDEDPEPSLTESLLGPDDPLLEALEKTGGDIRQALQEAGAEVMEDKQGHITAVWFYSIDLTDEGLALLVNLPWLERLEFHLCSSFTDAGLAELRGIGTLQWLALTRCSGVTPALLRPISRMSGLKGLYIAHCPGFEDEVDLSPLKAMTSLNELYLIQTGVSDSQLLHLTNLRHLRSLGLNSPNITDTGLKHLVRLSQLTEINATGTQVTPEGIELLHRRLPGCHVVIEKQPLVIPEDGATGS